MTNSYFFMSVGENTYYYTLRYSYIDYIWTHFGDGKYMSEPVRRDYHIRNLSHDHALAIKKVQELQENGIINEHVKLIEHPISMSDRKEAVFLDRLRTINEGVLLNGKFKGTHISKVDKGYILWVLINVYNYSNNEDDEQNILAQICYNYADSTGLLDQWVKAGIEAANNQVDYVKHVNQVINSDSFDFGKYSGKTFQEAYYTQAGAPRKGFADYISWLKPRRNIAELIELNSDDGCVEFREIDGRNYLVFNNYLIEKYLMENENQPELQSNSQIKYKLNNLELIKLMVQQNLNRSNGRHGYLFEWIERPLSVKRALVEYKIKCSEN